MQNEGFAFMGRSGSYHAKSVRLGLLLSTLLSMGCGDEKKDLRSGHDGYSIRDGSPREYPDPLAHPPELADSTKDAWAQKAARALVGSETPARTRRDMGPSSRRRFVFELMKKPQFIDTILDFNLYFLGFKEGLFRDNDGLLDPGLLRYPNAVTAARAMAEGGDYWSFFDWRQPLYAAPLRDPSPPGGRSRNPGERTDPRKIRKDISRSIQKHLDSALEVAKEKPFRKGKFCGRLFPQNSESLILQLFRYGVRNDLVLRMRFGNNWLGPASFFCFLPKMPKPDLTAVIKRSKSQFAEFFRYAGEITADDYQPATVRELKSMNAEKLGFANATPLTSRGFFGELPNSSTNYNRKRAAYVLKRYFCDDLTPINLAKPEDHAPADRHVSDPACQACHYKLDPMAGFFRNRGVIGLDFSDKDFVVFDDQAVKPRTDYQKAWQAKDSNTRHWNIGVIRSATNSQRNSYGQDLEDLFDIIKESRQPKKCLIRRLFSYLVGPDQVLDPGYLDYMTDRMIHETQEKGSSQALKRTVARIVLGRTFSKHDPVSDRCYDFAPDTDPSGRPPCEVRALLETHCTSCHSENLASGGLDLSRWIPGDDGPTFPHMHDGRQKPRGKTFTAIVERLSASDPKIRMPLDLHMPSTERQQLYLWANEQLGKHKGD